MNHGTYILRTTQYQLVNKSEMDLTVWCATVHWNGKSIKIVKDSTDQGVDNRTFCKNHFESLDFWKCILRPVTLLKGYCDKNRYPMRLICILELYLYLSLSFSLSLSLSSSLSVPMILRDSQTGSLPKGRSFSWSATAQVRF